MLAKRSAVNIDKAAAGRNHTKLFDQKFSVIAVGNKTDVLTFLFVGGGKVVRLGDGAYFRFA